MPFTFYCISKAKIMVNVGKKEEQKSNFGCLYANSQILFSSYW